MEYRQFGQTDLQVSAIGFGCWEIGGTYGQIDEGQFQRAVQRAIDSGINCFDTAEAYGMGVSEQALARALGPHRQDVIVVTKFGVGYDEMPNRRDSSRQRVMASIEKSLQRLQTDYIDVYLVHWPTLIRRSTKRCALWTTLSAKARRATSACPIFASASSRLACSCGGSMSCNMAGTCSTGACRPRFFRAVRHSISA